MSDEPIQRSLAEVLRMPAAEIDRALAAGELDAILSGQDPGGPLPEQGPPAPVSADLGARGSSLSMREWLRIASPEQVAAAHARGELDGELGIR